MTTTLQSRSGRATDIRAVAALADASGDVAETWMSLQQLTAGGLPVMGLAAGDRPAADVEVLAGAVASVEFELARRMHAAAASGALPLTGPGGMLTGRGWGGQWARRLARTGALAADHPSLAGAWAAGVITSEHLDPVARAVDRLTPEELIAVLTELAPLWGQLTPAGVARFLASVIQMLHPPPDPSPDEADAHEARSLSFALLADTVVLAGSLPRIEGEMVIAAIDSFAERLRSTADHVPPGARRADALVELVSSAHAAGALPTRGGLPVSLTVTLRSTANGDEVWTTSRGHLLTDAEQRFASCDAHVTPIVVSDGCTGNSVDGTLPARPG